MKFQGTIEQVFPEVGIELEKNEYSMKKEFLLNIESGKFPKSICIEVWNDKASNPNIAVGNQVTVECAIQSRKAGERYFNNIKAYKIDLTE